MDIRAFALDDGSTQIVVHVSFLETSFRVSGVFTFHAHVLPAPGGTVQLVLLNLKFTRQPIGLLLCDLLFPSLLFLLAF